MEKQLIFENINYFNVILIKPYDIDDLDWNDSNYTNDIIELDCYKILNVNSDNFIDNIIKELNIETFSEIKSQIICEMPNYIYEIIYIQNDDNNSQNFLINNIASLLNTNCEKIYRNAILMKTYIPSLSKSILIKDCTLNDIKYILDSRVKTNIVLYDNNLNKFNNNIVIGDIELFAKQYFTDDYKKLEIPFLLHNINIWYQLCEFCLLDNKIKCKCINNLCGKILETPIYKCIWFTMITDDYRGSLYLDEVLKIINISNKMSYPYNVKPEWLNDEKDEFNRPVIKNKYKILDFVSTELNLV